MGLRERANGVVNPPPDGDDASRALEVRGVAKHFGHVAALDGVDLSVTAGTVHALLGENGAGKTTLMRIVYGMLAPGSGDMRLFGRTLHGHTVRDAIELGVGMVHQHPSLAPNLTAVENLVLGGRGLLRLHAARELLRSVSNASGLQVPEEVVARDLSVVEQQRLEILKALARHARLLILDEPTATLAPAEIDDLLRWIRSFAGAGGTVVLVTHKLREALAVADDVTVLRRGRVTHAGGARASSELDLARAIFPDSVEERTAERVSEPGEVVVQADGVDVRDTRGVRRIRGASFQLRRHEIMGIAAVEGSGHRELLEVLAGLHPAVAGTLRLPERIGIIPGDRMRDALVPDFTLTENVALHRVGGRRGLLPWRAIAASTAALLERFSIVAASPRTKARALSGGNQQRLVVGRELENALDLVIADNPTRGLDLRATGFVHDQLRAAAASGTAVVVHSNDLDELLSLAARVLVVHHGDIREVDPTREAVGRAMLGMA